MLMVLVGHPFDTVKVRLQSMPTPMPGQKPVYAGMIDCGQKIFKKDGIKVRVVVETVVYNIWGWA